MILSGFVSEMRATAMKNEGVSGEMRATVMRLHAQEMALKERQAKADEGPMGLVCDSATRQGYLEFLVETKAVFDTLEELMAEAVDLTCENPPVLPIVWGSCRQRTLTDPTDCTCKS